MIPSKFVPWLTASQSEMSLVECGRGAECDWSFSLRGTCIFKLNFNLHGVLTADPDSSRYL
jgi:hypothetical protein